MKSFKNSGIHRLLSFVLIAVLLICVVGFAVGGLQLNSDIDSDSGDIGDTTENTDENKDLTDNNQTDDNSTLTPPEEPAEDIEKYYNKITGLEISDAELTKTPIGFVLDSTMPLYGVSCADITLEFPIENGKTRLLSYTTNYSALWKIGAMSPTRSFISFTSNLIGGIVVSYGNDDIIKYSAWDASKINLDISKISDCYYVENTLYIYTGIESVNSAMQNNEAIVGSEYKEPPFEFSDTKVFGTTDSKSVIIPYSDNNQSQFYYSAESEKYAFYKSGIKKNDMLNGKGIQYSNLFVLFANTTTYENSNGCELVLDNTSGGSGLYISLGKATEIKWSVNESGELEFRTLDGEILSVNRGNSFISYYKASEALKIRLS